MGYLVDESHPLIPVVVACREAGMSGRLLVDLWTKELNLDPVLWSDLKNILTATSNTPYRALTLATIYNSSPDGKEAKYTFSLKKIYQEGWWNEVIVVLYALLTLKFMFVGTSLQQLNDRYAKVIGTYLHEEVTDECNL